MASRKIKRIPRDKPKEIDGSDGDVVISADTRMTRNMYYNNLTVNKYATLFTDGYTVSVKNSLIINGHIAL